jgi:hypothetical protein
MGASSSSFGGGCLSRRACAVLSGAMLCLAAAGCGSSSHPAARVPASQRVCARAAQAAGSTIGHAALQIADSDPTNIECVLHGSGIRVDAIAQAATQAWTEYDTTVVHQAQAFAGTAQARSQLPQNVSIQGAQAVWIPAESELVATNGTESTAGSYVTVTVSGRPRGATGKVGLAESVGAAVLAVAPRGPSPGPPPS